MNIAPSKWTYQKIKPESIVGDWKDGVYRFFVIDTAAFNFKVYGIQEANAKRILDSLNGAMEHQRHEFLWGLANMHNQGTLYGGEEE